MGSSMHWRGRAMWYALLSNLIQLVWSRVEANEQCRVGSKWVAQQASRMNSPSSSQLVSGPSRCPTNPSSHPPDPCLPMSELPAQPVATTPCRIGA